MELQIWNDKPADFFQFLNKTCPTPANSSSKNHEIVPKSSDILSITMRAPYPPAQPNFVFFHDPSGPWQRPWAASYAVQGNCLYFNMKLFLIGTGPELFLYGRATACLAGKAPANSQSSRSQRSKLAACPCTVPAPSIRFQTTACAIRKRRPVADMRTPL